MHKTKNINTRGRSYTQINKKKKIKTTYKKLCTNEKKYEHTKPKLSHK